MFLAPVRFGFPYVHACGDFWVGFGFPHVHAREVFSALVGFGFPYVYPHDVFGASQIGISLSLRPW